MAKQKQPAKRNAPARALAKPEHRARVIPDKREAEFERVQREIARDRMLRDPYDHSSPWDD